jgi:hypothetical protein
MEKLKLDKKDLFQFGKKSTIGFLVLGILFFLLKKRIFMVFLAISAFFAILAFLAPRLLKYIYIVSIRLAEPIGWLMSKVIFTVFFFIIVTPIGIILKIFGKDLLNLKFEKNVSSYWLKKEPKVFDKEHFERQF